MEGVGSALVVGLRVWGVVCVGDAHSNKARTGHQQGLSLLRHPQLFHRIIKMSLHSFRNGIVRLPLSCFIC